MPSLNSCPRCGAEIRPPNAAGFCTRCLLEKGLEEPVDDPKALLSEGEHQTSKVSSEPGRLFGDYELLEEIARGGMGVIHRARQRSLERIVAVKMIFAGQFASKQIIQRFRGEVTAAALLQHPNIVAIHDVGIHDDQHYFSMDYVEGRNLAQLVGNRPLSPGKAARYVKLIAEAIHYAHRQGILHRDLKPSNILIDSATDQPRITDFGLAKRLDGESSLTVTGQVLGSPNFMPPEQARSDRGKVGRQSDVYGLGAILYYLLTGRAPFQADSLEAIVTQVLQSEPLAPRALNPSVPRDLETICLKCLTKEPHKRYATAGELAEELGRFLNDEPIQARPATQAEKAWRWCRRNPVVARLGVTLLLAIITGFFGVTWELHRVNREDLMTRRNLYSADMKLAQQAWAQGSLQGAQDLLRAHIPQSSEEDLRGFEWRYLWRLCQDESQYTFTNINFGGRHHGLALAADDHTVIAASGGSLRWLDWRGQREARAMIVGSNDISSISEATGLPGQIAYRTDRINALSPSGETLFGAGLPPNFGGSSDTYSDSTLGKFALSWDGVLIAATHPNKTVAILDVKTGEPLGLEFRPGENENIESLAFSPDSKYLACGTIGAKIHILEAQGLKQVNEIPDYTASVMYLLFDRAGTKLVSGSGDSHIRVWSFPDCRMIADITSAGGIDDLAISPDGRRLASGGSDHTVRLWDLANPGAPTFLHGHRGAVTSVLFSADGSHLYTGSDDGTVRVWDVSEHESTNILRHSGWADEVSFSPDGTRVVVAEFVAHTATMWQMPNRTRIGTVGEHSRPCRGVKFSPDGKLVATAGADETVQISDTSSRKRLWNIPTPANAPYGRIAFHPIKPIVAVAALDVGFWDLRNGNRMNLLPTAPTNGVWGVVFSPDGKWVALGMQDGQVTVWEFDTGRLLYSFHEHSKLVKPLCFSHDGTLLASAGDDNLIVLYDLRRGETSTLKGHYDCGFALAFAPDDKTLVSTSYDGTIRFWAVGNHQLALMLTHGGGAVTSVAFSPDGNLMATSGADGTVRFWPAANFEDVGPINQRAESRK